jgi:hypothetical protein
MTVVITDQTYKKHDIHSELANTTICEKFFWYSCYCAIKCSSVSLSACKSVILAKLISQTLFSTELLSEQFAINCFSNNNKQNSGDEIRNAFIMEKPNRKG